MPLQHLINTLFMLIGHWASQLAKLVCSTVQIQFFAHGRSSPVVSLDAKEAPILLVISLYPFERLTSSPFALLCWPLSQINIGKGNRKKHHDWLTCLIKDDSQKQNFGKCWERILGKKKQFCWQSVHLGSEEHQCRGSPANCLSSSRNAPSNGHQFVIQNVLHTLHSLVHTKTRHTLVLCFLLLTLWHVSFKAVCLTFSWFRNWDWLRATVIAHTHQIVFLFVN